MPTQVRERKVGDLFEYEIEHPVTIRRNQSALVPIVLRPFEGRPVLLYNKPARAENPMRCVEFRNTTGLTLEGGPVTVLEGEGAKLRIPALRGQPGQEIVAGIRPEDLHIVDDPGAADALTGTVELIESVGSEAFVHATSGGWRLIARSSPYQLPVLGASIKLQPAADRMHFFDAQSGQRLEA